MNAHDILTSGGRFAAREAYANDVVRDNAADLAPRVTRLLERYLAQVGTGRDPMITSGFRTAGANAAAGGAAHSAHLEGKAVDLLDASGLLTGFILTNPDVLEDCGLWMESPNDTIDVVHHESGGPTKVRWVHLQIERGPLTPQARIFDRTTGQPWNA